MKPAPELPAERRLALVVATTRYADASLRQLRAPAHDAADLTEVLADPRIGAFTVSSAIDLPAQEIRLAVEEFLTGRSPQDLLVVYVSCHGLIDIRRRLYFAATDTRKERLAATGVESQWLLDQMDDCRARRQVVILDCCFSGAFAHGAKADTDLGLGERFHGHGRGRVVLTASRASEYSFEGEPKHGKILPGSVFTAALVAGIRTGEADADNDGYISVDDAYTYAFDRIRTDDAPQTPQRWLYGAEGKILLARSPAGITIAPAPLRGTLRAGLDSPHPAIRLGAVATLGEWLTSDDPGRELTARQALAEVADTDVPQVAAAARALLGPAQATAPPGPPAAAESAPSAGAPGHDRAGTPPTPPLTPTAGQPPAPARGLRFMPRTFRSRAALAGLAVLLVTAVTLPAVLTSQARPATGAGHTGDVSSVAFSPDGTILASASYDHTVRLWNTTTQNQIGQPLEGQRGGLFSVAFSSDGKVVASGGYDQTVQLWNTKTHARIVTLHGHTGRVNSVAFSPDRKLLASGSDDDTVQLRDAVTYAEVGLLIRSKSGGVLAVAFSPDSKILASGGIDGTVKLWNTTTGKRIGQALRGHHGPVFSVAFSRDGTLASGGKDGTVRLWNTTTHRSTATLTCHSPVLSVAFSHDGKALACGTENFEVLLWNAATHQPKGPALTVCNSVVHSVAFSPVSNTLAIGCGNDIARLWNPDTGEHIGKNM
jgi:WD40 repeat protein